MLDRGEGGAGVGVPGEREGAGLDHELLQVGVALIGAAGDVVGCAASGRGETRDLRADVVCGVGEGNEVGDVGLAWMEEGGIPRDGPGEAAEGSNAVE